MDIHYVSGQKQDLHTMCVCVCDCVIVCVYCFYLFLAATTGPLRASWHLSILYPPLQQKVYEFLSHFE